MPTEEKQTPGFQDNDFQSSGFSRGRAIHSVGSKQTILKSKQQVSKRPILRCDSVEEEVKDVKIEANVHPIASGTGIHHKRALRSKHVEKRSFSASEHQNIENNTEENKSEGNNNVAEDIEAKAAFAGAHEHRININEIIEAMKSKASLEDHVYKNDVYVNCITGFQIISWLLESNSVKSEEEALCVGNNILRQGALVSITNDGELLDLDSIYQFSNLDHQINRLASEEIAAGFTERNFQSRTKAFHRVRVAKSKQVKEMQSADFFVKAMDDDNSSNEDDKEEMDKIIQDIEEVEKKQLTTIASALAYRMYTDPMVEKMKTEVTLGNHIYMGKNYENSFLGTEILAWFQTNGYAKSAEEALTLGNKILSQGNFVPVRGEAELQNVCSVFQFSNPVSRVDSSGLEKYNYQSTKGFSKPDKGQIAFAMTCLGYAIAAYSGMEPHRLERAIGIDDFNVDCLWVRQAETKINQPAHFVYHDKPSKRLFISIRGTQNTRDIVTNVQFLKKNISDGKGHRGFVSSAETILDRNFKEFINSPKVVKPILNGDITEIVIVGHSLGGATATAFTVLLREYLEKQNQLGDSEAAVLCYVKMQCVTFGSPPALQILDQESKIATICNKYITTYVNHLDPISALPLRSLQIPGTVYHMTILTDSDNVSMYKRQIPGVSKNIPPLVFSSDNFCYHKSGDGPTSYRESLAHVKHIYSDDAIGHISKLGTFKTLCKTLHFRLAKVTVKGDKETEQLGLVRDSSYGMKNSNIEVHRLVSFIKKDLWNLAYLAAKYRGLEVMDMKVPRRSYKEILIKSYPSALELEDIQVSTPAVGCNSPVMGASYIGSSMSSLNESSSEFLERTGLASDSKIYLTGKKAKKLIRRNKISVRVY